MAITEYLPSNYLERDRHNRLYGLIRPAHQGRYLQASASQRLLNNFRQKFAESTDHWFLYTDIDHPSRQIRLDNYPEGDNEVFSIIKPIGQAKNRPTGVFFCVCVDMLVDQNTGITRVEIHHSEEDLIKRSVISEPEVGGPDVKPGLGNDSVLFADVLAKSVPTNLTLAA